MRFSRKNAIRSASALVVAMALLCFAFARSGSEPLKAAPPKSTPAVTSPSPSGTPMAAQPAPSTTTPSASATQASPATPTLSAADKEALNHVAFHWDVFVLALNATDGTKLKATQLAKPTTVVAANLSGCPPGTENRLAAAIRAAVAFCGNEVRVVTQVFIALNDSQRRLAVAGAFLYHALAKTTAAQRSFNYNKPRTNAQMIGCLQASLSYAFERYGGGQPEDVWVVMSNKLNGGDVYSAYNATYDFNGEWM